MNYLCRLTGNQKTYTKTPWIPAKSLNVNHFHACRVLVKAVQVALKITEPGHASVHQGKAPKINAFKLPFRFFVEFHFFLAITIDYTNYSSQDLIL